MGLASGFLDWSDGNKDATEIARSDHIRVYQSFLTRAEEGLLRSGELLKADAITVS